MTQREAREWGRHSAGEWLLQGRISPRSAAAGSRGDLRALLRTCERWGDGANRAQRSLLDQLWLLLREVEPAIEAMRRAGPLPAVPVQGRCPRVVLLGERLCTAELTQWSELRCALEGLQELRPLTEEELYLLPTALVLGVLRRVRLLAERDDGFQQAEVDDCFARLRLYTQRDWAPALEELSVLHRCLLEDGVYAQMEEVCRARYRREAAKRARRSRRSEPEEARALLERSAGAHVGFVLFPPPKGGGAWYPALVLGLTTALTAAGALLTGTWWSAALLLLPVSELVKQTVDFCALHLKRPRPVFRLALKEGVPPEGRTLCVICALLTDEQEVRTLCERLEDCFLTNRAAGEQVVYGLLADDPDAPEPPGPAQRALLEQTKGRILGLNRRWGSRFVLLKRESRYAEADDLYRGWERKRGALMELLDLLRGAPSSVNVAAGDVNCLKKMKFLLTLDSDTRLAPDAVRVLVGSMLHPLNRPELDPKTRTVVRGHGLLQPRMVTQLESANRSPFAALFCGAAGSDPYTAAAGELYHDLFDRCSYCGKGLLDVEAAALCLTGRFPENRILSHDLLEGAFLRCGACPQAEAADGFPATAQSFFRREHRWVRGDWQAGRWCTSRVPTAAGVTRKNPLCAVDRWKLLDNLRRSLLPPGLVLCAVLWAILPGKVTNLGAVTALLALALPMLFSGAELTLRRFHGCAQRTFAPRYDGFTGALLRLLCSLCLLPARCWTNLSAIVTALWRLHVTHRGLLEWTVSAQERGGRWFRVPNLMTGAALLLLAPLGWGTVLGALWLLSPLALQRLNRPTVTKPRLSQREEAWLRRQGALIWSYFDTWLRPEDHFLPPDNVQELPALGPARRTSPTNIGLALLACLSALDLGLTERERAVFLLKQQLDTLEGLEKWQGHLYNWYDTAAAQPLYPRYVSTVDSGNLCAALLTLETGLAELGEPELARRAGKLASEMRFRPLYDPKRELFYIGWDAEENSFTDSRYDLLASEARLTSYVAVARGEVPPKHWQRLGRGLCEQSCRYGLVSWSGTLFEYFMPHLLLAAPRGSLLWESLHFCVHAQRRWGARLGLPWGVSESAFCQLDQSQSYQYKAHGVPCLALCRGMERERVIAPYASFLALSAAPHAAIRNLRRLSELGALGRHGFYEAVDCTPRRTGGRAIVVQSWMVHHLGMSLLAVDNVLMDNALRRRFHACAELRAHRCLLEERMPLGLTPPKRLPIRVKRSKMDKMTTFERSGQGFDPARPACHLLRAGALSLHSLANGGGVLRQEELLLCGDERLTFTSAGRTQTVLPRCGGGSELGWRWKGDTFTLDLQLEGAGARLKRRLDETGLVSRLEFHSEAPGTLRLCLDQILDREPDFEAHRAFSRLGLERKPLPSGVCITRRQRRELETPALVLLWEGPARVLDRTGAPLTLELDLVPGDIAFAWAVCPGKEQAAYHAAQGLLLGLRTATEDGFSALCQRFGLTGQECAQVDALSARLLWPGSHEGKPEGQKSLWPFGISGDLPLWFVPGADRVTGERCVRIWGVLHGCGLSCDLALLCSPEDRAALENVCEELALGRLLGGRGGIHLISERPEAANVLSAMAEHVGPPPLPENRFVCAAPAPERAMEPPQVPRWRWEGEAFHFTAGPAPLPRRWTQVLTNGRFGWAADERGTGSLWSGNAHENKLTPWYNDETALHGPERLFVEENGVKTALFAANDGIPVDVCYGPGFARWEKRWEGRRIALTAFVPVEGEERLFLVEAEGFAPAAELAWMLELQLAPCLREAQFVTFLEENGRILAQNPASPDYAGQTLALAGTAPLTMERGHAPNSLTARCALADAQVLSAGTGLAPTTAVDAARAALERVQGYWREAAGALQVTTPDPALNHYLSFWGRYQVLSCRVYARAALYQCGGAYGFRDQLQDVSALLPEHRELVRAQILRCCARQYREGDVQHWWHPLPVTDRGVRTRISDDLLWLPWAVCRWVSVTGDRSLLEETVPYLNTVPLQSGERDRFEDAVPSEETGTVLEHCERAIERFLARGTGAHGLPLIGSGDWNDGMDNVGAQGRGESVWLAWFGALVLQKTAELCAPHRRERYEERSRALLEAAERCWDGAWYLRAYGDDGHPIGSKDAPYCQIDSIAQSFAVFAGADGERQRRAIDSTVARLYDPKLGTVALLTPPFPADAGVGYLCGYPEGVRENGAQYTHAAVWLALAAYRLGQGELGWRLLKTLLPEHHDPDFYQGEPFVLAGDVWTSPTAPGRAGWTWYTGAAGWYCRAATEELLGLRVRGGRLYVEPQLPARWPGYEARWRLGEADLHLRVTRGQTPGLLVNGSAAAQGIPLSDLKGTVELQLTL